MTVERPNVESADKIEAVDKLSRGIGVRQGTKLGVWWWWQISQNQQVTFPWTAWRGSKCRWCQTQSPCRSRRGTFCWSRSRFPSWTDMQAMFVDVLRWRMKNQRSTIASICAWIVSMRGQRTGQCQCSTQPRWCATKSGRKMIAFNIFYLDRYPYFENVYTCMCMMYSFN